MCNAFWGPPVGDHTVTIELYYGGAWHPAPVYTRDGLTIMRGAATPGAQLPPGSAEPTIDNRTGNYSPRNVAGALYGLLAQNMPARVTVDGDVRITGEVAQFKPERALGGDAWTKIQVAGVLQRIGRGTDALANPAQRRILSLAAAAYYPLSDGTNAASAVDVAGGAALAVRGAPQLASVAGPGAGDTSHPQFLDSSGYIGGLTGTAPASSTGEWTVEFWFRAVASASSATAVLASWHTTGTYGAMFWVAHIAKVAGTHHVYLAAQHDLSTATGFSKNGGSTIDGAWHQVRVTAKQNTGSEVHVEFIVDDVLADSTTASTWTVGDLESVTLGDYDGEAGVLYPTADVDSLSLAHLALWPSDDPASTYEAGGGYVGETADDRFLRLCTEEGIDASIVGTADDTVTMGPQTQATLLELLAEIERTDDASVYEDRDTAGLVMRTGASKLNQAPDLTLYYDGGQVAPPLEVVVGDEGIRNDVTAASPGGASRRVQQLTGPRNVQAPSADPQGVGRYATRIDVNPETDDALADAAGWRVSHGTYDGTWYAAITVDLDAAPYLATLAAAVDIGDCVSLANLPVDEALDAVEHIVIGIWEDAPPKRRTITYYCVPAAPYQVGLLAETSGDTDPFVGHLDSDGSTTNGSTAAGAAAFAVETPAGPLWTTDSDDFPLDVIVGGQRVSVASIIDYLNVNPHFETDAAGWTPAGATFARSTAQFHQGAASGLLTPDGVTATPQLEGDLVPATVGRTYRMAAWVRCAAARTIDIYIGFYDESAALITASGTSWPLAADTWTLIEQTGVAPALTTQTRMVLFEPGTPPASATLYIDEAMAIDTTLQTFIVDTAGYPVAYPIPADSAAAGHQPLIPTL
jgi:hypothetical protein